MLRRRYIMATSGDESRARAAIIDSLEDCSVKEQYFLFWELWKLQDTVFNVYCVVLRLFKTNFI